MFARAAMLTLLAVLAMGRSGIGQTVASTQTAPSPSADAVAEPPAPTTSLPIPPVPPRIAEGHDYDQCLDMLANDPEGASTFATAWASGGGGDGAAQCQALAQIELGNAETGAAMLQHLADTTTAPDLARALVYGQAVQGWLMADRPDHALDAATLALALSPNDVDLLIDRAVAETSVDRYQDAIGDLNRALASDPRRVEAFVLRASAWRHLNNLTVATSDIEHALEIDPENAEALLERGILRQLTGNRTGAREDWQRAVNLDPNSTTADLAEQDLALLDAGPKQ
jgi:tetratricopeptide (TPR) repeat protein